jgi:hypothetical protein
MTMFRLVFEVMFLGACVGLVVYATLLLRKLERIEQRIRDVASHLVTTIATDRVKEKKTATNWHIVPYGRDDTPNR